MKHYYLITLKVAVDVEKGSFDGSAFTDTLIEFLDENERELAEEIMHAQLASECDLGSVSVILKEVKLGRA